MSRDPKPGPTQPGTPWPDPDPHPNGPTGPRQRPEWLLTLTVWATSPWLDPRVRHGRRAGRLSYAFPVTLALAFAGLWIGGAA